jgi:hypothetical protein
MNWRNCRQSEVSSAVPAMVRRGQRFESVRGLRVLLLSACFRCLVWRRPRASASMQRPPASTVDVVPRSARRAGGSPARVRRARGDRNGGRSWWVWRPCSGRGRRSRCRHGARMSRTCVGDRRPCPLARSQQRVARASTRGYGSCAGRGSCQVRRVTPTRRRPARAWPRAGARSSSGTAPEWPRCTSTTSRRSCPCKTGCQS